jgi:ABC-type branched-subunit amino acid transport system substrate-binding protein
MRSAIAGAWVCALIVPQVLWGCSALVDSEARQCRVTEDCAALGNGSPLVSCSAAGFCIGPRTCADNSQCSSSSLGPEACVDSVCVPVFSSECKSIVGQLSHPRALVYGQILSTTGINSALGRPERNAVALAVGDFERLSGGVPSAPGGKGSRPLVFVECDDGSDVEAAVRAAQHLVDNLRVPAIIGPSTSGGTVLVSTRVTIPGRTLLIAPSSSSVAITDLRDDGLVWRTSSSDRNQVATVARFLPYVEADVRRALALPPSEPVRMAVLHKGDVYGVTFANALTLMMSLNGIAATDPLNKEQLLVRNYGDPNDQANPPNYDGPIGEAIGFRPHIIAVPGTHESLTVILKRTEERWTEPRFRPRWLFGSVSTYGDVGGSIGTNDELRGRVMGVVSGTTSAVYRVFEAYYQSSIRDGTKPGSVGAAHAYDAVYLIAHATAAARGKPVSGPNLAEGLLALLPGPGVPKISVEPSTINRVFSTLERTGRVDLEGASGPLDFDPATGDTITDTQLYCISKDATGRANGTAYSGWYLAAGAPALTIPPGQTFPDCR